MTDKEFLEEMKHRATRIELYTAGDRERLERLISLATIGLDSQGSGWMPIADAPKDGSRVLLSNGSSASIQVGHWEKEHDYPRMNIPAHWSDEGEGFELHPSHWMPPPSPPKEPK